MKDVALAEVQLRTLQGLNQIPINFINVKTEEFNIVSGKFLLRLIADSLEAEDIVIVVLDPRLSDRPHNSLGIKLKNGAYLLGPNNGVFSWIIKDFSILESIELNNNENTKKFPTFNGKYKFSLAANKILSGHLFSQLGKAIRKSELFIEPINEGQIVHIDNYGNLKIHLPRLRCKVGQKIFIKFRNQTSETRFGKEFDDVSPGELITYNGSSLYGLPEIAINKGNAAKYFGAKVGDEISLKPIT